MKKQTLMSEHWFFGEVLRNKKAYTQVALATFIINIFALVSSFFVMIVYDRILPNNATDSLIALTIGVSIVIIFDFVFKMLRSTLTDRAGSAIDDEISKKLFDKLARNEKLIDRSPGQVASTVKDFEQIKEFLGSATFIAFIDFPFLIVFLLAIYAIAGSIAIIPTVIVLFVIMISLLVQPIIRRLAINGAINSQNKQANLVEMLNGVETLKTLTGVDFLKKRWLDNVSKQNTTSKKSKFWSSIPTNLAQSGQLISQVSIVFAGVYLIAANEMTMGSLIAAVILSGRAMSPLSQITNLLSRLNQTLTAYAGFAELLSDNGSEKANQDQLRIQGVSGEIEISNLSMTYEGADSATLSDINLSIPAGEHIAIVGRNGSGKTTLLRLLSGVYKSSSGSIQFDQNDVRHLHPDDIRQFVGVSPQKPVIFSGTVKDNLLMGNPEATDEQIQSIANATGLNRVISSLANGYSTHLSEGGRPLSGGQQQLLAATRALINNPNIIILDEPTAALDTQSEELFVKSLKEYSQNKTLILITHRPAILNAVDRVITLEEGRVKSDQRTIKRTEHKPTIKRKIEVVNKESV